MAGKATAKATAAATGKGVTKTGKRRTKKDPNAPKRSLSAYMYFAKDKRIEIVNDQPHLKSDISRVGKLIGEAWAKLHPDRKAHYDKKAAVDKARYEKEITAYRKKA